MRESPSLTPGKNKVSILLVDDEPDITTVVKRGLERFGFAVASFNDPLEALSSFSPDTYDIAILDIRMPHMNGFALYKKLKKVDDKIRICFITAFEIYEAEFKKVFPTYDIRYFIRKPIRLKELAELLEKMLLQEITQAR